MVSYATLSVAQRELEVLLMLAGQLACEGLNWVLKRCFKQQRPKRSSLSFLSYLCSIYSDPCVVF